MSSARTAILMIVFLAVAAVGALRLNPAMAGDTVINYTEATHLTEVNPDEVDWKTKDDDFWKKTLSDIQVRVCREAGTERAFTGARNANKDPGAFHCSSCGLLLFQSEHKFDSGTGWPSYWQPATEDAVDTKTDYALGMMRTEVVCGRCDAHLGHVFDDGPKPTGKRYCINSVCLLHKPAE